MKKYLGVGFVFQAIDKGMNKLFDKVNNKLQQMKDDAEDAAEVKPKKGSFWDAISEISKLGLLKNIADGIGDATDKANELSSLLGGKGLGESFKDLDTFAASYANRLSGAELSAEGIQKLARDISEESRIGLKASGELLQIFDRQGLSLKDNEDSLKFLGRLQKITNVDAGELGGTYATLTKNLGLSQSAAKGLFEQVTILEAKSGKKGLVADLPDIVNNLRQAAESGLIPKGQIQTISKTLLTYRAGLENTGMSVENAKSATDEYLESILGVRKAFVEAQFGAGDIEQLSRDFGFAGQNVAQLQAAVKKGDVTAFLTGLGDATKGLPQDRLQDFTALLSSKFGPGVATTFANFRKKGFGEIVKLSNDISQLDTDTRKQQAGQIFENIINSVNEKEEELKAANERFDNIIDNEVSKSNRKFIETQIQFNNELSKRVAGGTTTAFDDIIVATKKFQKAGLTPFAGSISETLTSLKIFGNVSEESIGKSIAALNVFTPLISESSKEIFFFTGALANIMKISPGPKEIFGTLVSGAAGAADKFKKMGGVSGALSKTLPFLSGAMRGVGVAVRFATGPIGLAITGATILGTALYQAYQRSETFRNGVDAIWESMKGFGGMVLDVATTHLPKLWNGLKTVTKFTLNWLTPFGLIYNLFGKLTDIFPNFFGGIKKYVLSAFESVNKVFKDSFVGKVFTEILDSFKTGSKTIADVAESGGLSGIVAEKSMKGVSVSADTPTNQPETVAARSLSAPQAESLPDSPSAGGAAYAGRTATTTSASQAAAANIKEPAMKEMALLFSSLGQDIINAVSAGGQNITITLQGDARKLFRAQSNKTANQMATTGLGV